MFANGSCLPERSARRNATVTSSVPLAISASRISSFDANFPVPTISREVNSRSAIFSLEGLSAISKTINELATRECGPVATACELSKASQRRGYSNAIFHCTQAADPGKRATMTKFDLRQEDCVKGMSQLPNERVDLVVTSPPYNLGVRYGKFSDRQDRQSYLRGARMGRASPKNSKTERLIFSQHRSRAIEPDVAA